MTLKLYKLDASPTVRAVLMALEALKVNNYETQEVDLMAGEHKTPEYLEKNPAHTIPMIEDDNFALADSHAILTYLASKYGDEKQSNLYPSELRLRATIIQRLFFEATVLITAYRTLAFGIIRHGQTVPTPEQIDGLLAAYEILDKYLQKTKFVACDHITIADISCVASISTADFWVAVDDRFPKLKAWFNTLKEEDWYKKGNLPGLISYKKQIKSRFNVGNDSD